MNSDSLLVKAKTSVFYVADPLSWKLDLDRKLYSGYLITGEDNSRGWDVNSGLVYIIKITFMRKVRINVI